MQANLRPKRNRLGQALAGLALISLIGCTGEFYREAGAEVDEGGFGNPTMTNSQLMANEISATSALAGRFASEVPSTITFAFNSSVLSEAAKGVLRTQATWIKQFPEVRFRVYGHTDLVGSNAYNKALGLRRAQATVAYLSGQGISLARLEAVASFGETQPVVQTQSPEQRNRRTVTEVIGFVKGRGGQLNGKYAEVIFREYVQSATRPIIDTTTTNSQVNPTSGG